MARLPTLAVIAIVLALVAAAGCIPDGPQVVSTTPAAGATGMAVTTPVMVRFDRAMDASSLANGISISPPPPGGAAFGPATDPASAMLVSSAPLSPDTVYTLTVGKEARDAAGKRLLKPVTVTFRTAGPRQVTCSSPVWSPDGSRLAWMEDLPGGSRSLWVANQDGTGIRRLIEGIWPGSRATWTPDGTGLVASIRGAGGAGQVSGPLLALIGIASGSAPQPLALNSELADSGQITVTFSPDGAWMAVQNDMYMADAHSDYLRQLGVARADGTGVEFFGNLLVGWGADSRSLLYLDMPGIGDGHSFNYDVWRYTLATGAKTRVSGAGVVHNFGAVSRAPDGTHFIYSDWEAEDVKTPDGWEIVRLPGDLWRMSINGASIVRLTSGTGHSGFPAAGRGGSIAFASDRGGDAGGGTGTGNWDVWILASPEPGAQATNLTRRAGYDGQPAFSPAGNLIAYVSDTTGNREIWILAADGSGNPRIISGIEGSVGK